MGIEAIFIAIAFGSVAITRGSYRQLFSTRLNHLWSLGVVIVGSLTINFLPISKSLFDSIGFALLLTTYIFLFGFCVANIQLKGMWIVLAGLASNALVISLNRGMPVTTSGGYFVRESIKYQSSTSHDLLPFLSDIIPINFFSLAISIGDIIFGIGIISVFFFASHQKQKDGNEDTSMDEELVYPVNDGQIDPAEVSVVDITDEFVAEIDLTQPETIDTKVMEPISVASSRGPRARNRDRQLQEKLERATHSRAHKRWRKTHGLAALPSKEALGFDEEAMQVVDVAGENNNS